MHVTILAYPHIMSSLFPVAVLQVLSLVGESFQKHVPEVAGLPIIGLSALTGAGAEKLMPAVLSAYELWTQRVPTSRLNSWLAKVFLPTMVFLSVSYTAT